MITDVKRMNENIHEMLELVEKVGALETEMNERLEKIMDTVPTRVNL